MAPAIGTLLASHPYENVAVTSLKVAPAGVWLERCGRKAKPVFLGVYLWSPLGDGQDPGCWCCSLTCALAVRSGQLQLTPSHSLASQGPRCRAAAAQASRSWTACRSGWCGAPWAECFRECPPFESYTFDDAAAAYSRREPHSCHQSSGTARMAFCC